MSEERLQEIKDSVNFQKEILLAHNMETLCVDEEQELIEEIERLNNIIKTKDEGIKAFTEDLCEESAKIEKAVEYIEKHTENIDRGKYYEDYVETYPILQILKGSDKE